jgi:predicted permease
LLVLLGSVGFVLLIACVNVAGLMLVRGASRSRDLAVRAALGASRGRLVSQGLAEAAVISLLGAVAGALIAWSSVGFLAKLASAELPRSQAIRVDGELLGFTVALAIVTGIVFGLVPALAASRGDVNEALRAGGRSATQSARHARLRHVLVVGEVALASALLIGAGLFLRSFVNLLRVAPGFAAENVVTGILSTPDARYMDASRVRFFRDLNARISALPGVLAVGASSDVPWSGYDENAGFEVEGRVSGPNDSPHARYHSATPDYFRAMGIPLLRGRFFTDRDDMSAPLAIIINHSMAEKYWPGADAVGKRITFADKPREKDWFQVVGVVGDVKDAPSSKEPQPALWWSFGQQQMRDMLLVIRTVRDPLSAVNAIRAEIAALDRELPLAQVRTMEEIAGASRGGARLVLLLTGIFAGIALLLAAIGTYGVISYSVAQRTQEFGLRIALGARGFDLLRLIGGQGLRLAAAGIAIGLVLALALGRLLSSLLYGVSAYDPWTLIGSFGIAVVMVVAACLVPARRAASVDPMVSLRCD